jgi:pimeloyl-ACP methyl ester carboxylesterase
MSSWLASLIVVAAAGVGLWLASHVVEALRRSPTPPAVLPWAPEIPIQHLAVDGVTLRYIKTGAGPTLVLLHTLRTQLDLFERVVPDLARHFTIYALDYPGHGYSDIPHSRYDAGLFVKAVEGFLARLDLRDVTLAGVSIGGVIPLLIAARQNPRVIRAISVNPYDYAQGLGLARSSVLGRLITYAALVPVLGETVMRLRSFIVMRPIMLGGVADRNGISPALMEEMYRVGNRPWHYRALISLLRNGASWEQARGDYPRIQVPVLLIWGSEDWSYPPERERTRALIPHAVVETIPDAGHFLPLDRPREFIALIVQFADA